MKMIFISIALSVFLFSASVEAHKVTAYAYREGDKVIGECYFVDGSPCKNSRVEVYSSKGNKILETNTDEQGRFSFVVSEKGSLKIVIPAGEGHRAEFTLEAVEREIKKVEKKKTETKEMPKISGPQGILMNKEEIREMMDEVLEMKLQGVRAEIMDLHKKMDKITIRDIIAGIGYIFGLWGLIMFIKRKKHAS